MSDPENSTVLGEIHSLFPVLLFRNKHSNAKSELEEDTITSQQTPKVSGLKKMEGDEGVCAAA